MLGLYIASYHTFSVLQVPFLPAFVENFGKGFGSKGFQFSPETLRFSRHVELTVEAK